MAGVGSVQGDNTVQDSDDSSDKAWTNGGKIFRINGVHNVYTNGEKIHRTMDNKRLKLSVLRVNGSQKITVKSPGPTLKTRDDKLTVNSNLIRTRRNSARQDSQDISKR